MSSPRRGGPDPFWLCHECGAQMRPIRVDGVPHCASCNGEFIEILDSEVNPDPFHELPPAPPVRPGSAPSYGSEPHSDGGGGFMQSLFSGLMGMAGQEAQGSENRVGSPTRQGQSEPGVWTFNIGNGTGRVMFGSFNGSRPGPAGLPPQFRQGGLDAFFPGFPPPGGQRGYGPGDPLAGQDLLRAIMAALEQDGSMPPGMFGPQGRMDMGDYVNTQHGFDQILEQLMQAAGPQGPLPASDTVIDGLPRFKLDEETLEKSQFKDCPVCKDDFTVGEEVMRIPCKHIFHPDCLVPWLKTNGSCPVCRFSLLPDEENRRPASAPPNPTASPRQPETAPGTGSDWQSTITNTLNRLFGQGGAPTSPTDERNESSGGVRDYSTLDSNPTSSSVPLNSQPSAQPPIQPTQPPAAAATAANISGQAAAPDPPSPPAPATVQPSAIPEDYRERHRRREREEHPYGDDLD